MQNNRNRTWIGALCLFVLACPPAVRADDGGKPEEPKAATLAQPLKAKDSVQYRNTLTMSAGGADILVEQNHKFTVKEVKENGDIVMVMSDLGGKFTINGSDMDIPPGSTTTVVQTKNGRIITYTPEMEDNPYLSTPTLHLLSMVDHIVFPDHPVKPGESWKSEVDNPAVKGKKVSIKTTFVGPDKSEGTAVWKIKQTVEAETEDAGNKLTAETTALLDMTTGQLIQAEHEVKNIPGKMGPIDWKSKLQRIKPDAAKPEKADK